MTVGRHNPTRREVLGAAAVAPILLLPAPTPAGAAGAAAAHPAPPVSLPPAEAEPRTLRFDYVCRTCQGNAVTRDAWAEWDAEEQEWVLGEAFDYAYCHDCDAETQLEEVELGSE